jgi:hypothetical protein
MQSLQAMRKGERMNSDDLTFTITFSVLVIAVAAVKIVQAIKNKGE